MSYLLDTHILIWWFEDPKRLTSGARDLMGDRKKKIFVSAVSAWEIALKRRIGKLKAPDDLEIRMEEESFAGLPVTIAHALAVERLPAIHADPFDRMLITQAKMEGVVLITRDQNIRRYDVPVLAG